ncbi:hypothetical protein HMPREF1624_03658 [Sporothrix schenckii ATCC 58251]|uniref:Putative zinc-finger domain-containing protein n=1 Tax=Sporothrix schenckii (strain ATCC 58251 / de Perez 2211183) TaxID=1391915 RepID=U7PZA4_SPOS1|nr:hypothetical protein HMPREF1624_03658 [Sporothrix schenckii ATCC 58251]
MAGYPYSHGQWPPQAPPPPASQGSHPVAFQQQYPQYDYRPSSNPPPAMYNGNSYQVPPPIPSPGAVNQQQSQQSYYGAVQAAQAAFDQNTQVSGLGISVALPEERSPNAVGGDLSWSEAFPTSQPTPSAHPPYNPGLPQVHTQQHNYHQQRPPQPVPPQQMPPQHAYSPAGYAPPPAASTTDLAYNPEATVATRESEPEEGELSEDMEDLYEPEETSGSTGNGGARTSRSVVSQEANDESFAQVGLGHAAADLPSRDASVIDTQEDAFYDDDDDNEPGEIKSGGNGDESDADDEDMGYSDSEPKSAGATDQERAATYSPRLSPGEIEDSDNADTRQSLQKDSSGSAGPTVGAAIVTSDGTAVGNETASGVTTKVEKDAAIAAKEAMPSSNLIFTTMDDAKKEAQRAILRLIPYGVNYQTYIDEGFDSKLIQSLFSELGLKAVPTAVSASPRSASPSQSIEPAASQPEPGGDKTAPKEERKDRIARLLALQASKPTPAPVPKPPVAAAATKPDKPKSQKEIMLQQKLEALRQAQEKRAAAATTAAAKATALRNTVSGHQGDVAAAIVGQIADKTAAISAALPSSPATSSRQRPVAADFGGFASSAVHSLPTRPPAPVRQESSMIIEVSDDSDEDVAMELDSQADDSYSRPGQYNDQRSGGASLYREQQYNNNVGKNGIGRKSPADHSYSSPRGYAGRAPPMMPAPPTAPASMIARAKDDEYTRKMRQIEEMKRKIAEAEARKSKISPAGSLTPQTGGNRTPSDGGSSSNRNNESPYPVLRPAPQPLRRITSNGELWKDESTSSPMAPMEEAPIRVAKRTGGPSPSSSQESHREKRVRVASLQLPRVEASLQEKMFKLRLLQERVAALQAEIDEGVAEKRRLTEDAEDLGSEQEEASTENEASVQPHQSQPPTDEPINDAGRMTDVDLASQQLDGLGQQEEEKEGEIKADDAPSHGTPSDAESSVGLSVARAEAENSQSNAASESDPVQMSDSANASDEDGDIEMLDNASDGEGEPDEDDEIKDGGGSASDSAIDDGGVAAVAELFHEESQQQHSNEVVTPARVAAKPSTATFTPYESPLQYFESYRFHPQYKTQVPGGFRSLTYSGKIQDDIALCPNEFLGDDCSDPLCSFQHIASIVPKDDQILVELGRSDDYTGDQKARFVDGLKNLLKKFRDDHERDFDKIAEGIIDFRRRFLGDDSRVLAHLEGITV